MEQSTGKKIFHICMILAIVIIILIVVGLFMLHYQVSGETNLPFDISKITIISTVDGKNNPDETNMWNVTATQNNDIYIYIDKNENYQKKEVIDSVRIDNITINKDGQKGELRVYKPVNSDKELFNNKEENLINEITFTGDVESNIKELKIANQGDLIRLRFANENLATYVSGEGEQVDYSKLLQLTNTNMDEIKANITFNFTINLKTGKAFKTNISLEIPVDGVIENGTASKEITDTKNIIFKRIENN